MNKKLSLVMLLPVFSLGAHCSGPYCPEKTEEFGYYLEENNYSNKKVPYQKGFRQGDVFVSASDKDILLKVRKQLEKMDLSNGENIRISVNHGVVSLFNSPSDEEETEDIYEELMDIDGVRGVQFRSGQRFDNSQLIQRIKNELSRRGSLRSYPRVQVIMIEEGVVTLRGNALTAKDVDELKRRVRNIPGVKDVMIEVDIQEDRSMSQSYGRNSREYVAEMSQDALRDNLNDQSLEEKIYAKLTDTWFAKSYPNVRLKVADGVVTLSGTVPTEKDIHEVEKRVWDVSGVKSVNSELSVEQQNQSSRNLPNRSRSVALGTSSQNSSMMQETLSDKPLKEKVQAQLVSYPNVEVMIVEGVVRLKGTVPEAKDIQEIEKRVRSISGVKDVMIEVDIQEDKLMNQSYGRNSKGYLAEMSQDALRDNLNDQSLREKIQAKLTDTWFAKSYPNVQIKVVKGAVTLSGTVPHEKDIHEVEKRVWDVSGVKSVNSELRVEQQNQSSRNLPNRSRSVALGTSSQNSSMMQETLSDKPLKEKLQAQLVSYPDVEVMIVEGIVTLKGSVPSQKDIQEIEKRVRALPEVKDVAIEVEVKPSK